MTISYKITRANIFPSTKPLATDNGAGVSFPAGCENSSGFTVVWDECMGTTVEHTDVAAHLLNQTFEADSVDAAKVQARALLTEALVLDPASTIVPSASAPYYNPISGGGHTIISRLNHVQGDDEEEISFDYQQTKDGFVFAFLEFAEEPAAAAAKPSDK